MASYTVPQPSVAMAESPEPGIFRLPPELRTIIYEHVLVSDRRVHITEDFEQPALLRTSRQLRSETYGIWHGRNKFQIDV